MATIAETSGLQALKDGFQQELPDIWLTNGNPWELKRPNVRYSVGFYGEAKDGKWVPAEKVPSGRRHGASSHSLHGSS